MYQLYLWLAVKINYIACNSWHSGSHNSQKNGNTKEKIRDFVTPYFINSNCNHATNFRRY